MKIIKDLVLGLKTKILLPQFITQQYSSNELFDSHHHYHHSEDLPRNFLNCLHTFPRTV